MPKKSNGSGKKKPTKLHVVKPHSPEPKKIDHPKPPAVKITAPKSQPIIIKPAEPPISRPANVEALAETPSPASKMAKHVSKLQAISLLFLASCFGLALGILAASLTLR